MQLLSYSPDNAATAPNSRTLFRYRSFWLYGLVLLVLAGFVFGPNLGNPLLSDDWNFVQPVAQAHTPGEVLRFFGFGYEPRWFVRPMQWVVTWIIYGVAGTNPLAYHLASLALDLANGLLFGVLAYRLLLRTGLKAQAALGASAIAVMLFIFNWRHHETAFWYSAINEILAALCRLSALWLAAYAFDPQRTRSRRAAAYALALAAYALALLSKESAVVLPAEILIFTLYLYLTGRRDTRPNPWQVTAGLAPFLLILVIWAAGYRATSADQPVGVVARGGLTFLPHASPGDLWLRFIQHINGHFMGNDLRAPIRSPGALAAESLLLGLMTGLAIWRRRHLWLLALLWTLITVAPYALVARIDQVQAHTPVLTMGIGGDRYLYYSSAAAALLVIASAQWAWHDINRLEAPVLSGAARGAISLGVLGFLAVNLGVFVWFAADWRVAGQIADRTRRQILTAVPEPAAGSTLCLGDLPDMYHSKYVWRNGIEGALEIGYGGLDFNIRKTVQPDSPLTKAAPLDETGCSYTFVYDPQSQALIRRR